MSENQTTTVYALRIMTYPGAKNELSKMLSKYLVRTEYGDWITILDGDYSEALKALDAYRKARPNTPLNVMMARVSLPTRFLVESLVDKLREAIYRKEDPEKIATIVRNLRAITSDTNDRDLQDLLEMAINMVLAIVAKNDYPLIVKKLSEKIDKFKKKITRKELVLV